MLTHQLKIFPEFFEAIRAKDKTFELRKNDRSFQLGDVLILKEFDQEKNKYTGRWVKVKITYILQGEKAFNFGLRNGFCCMSLNIITEGYGLSNIDSNIDLKAKAV